jgi:hypothetical protein
MEDVNDVPFAPEENRLCGMFQLRILFLLFSVDGERKYRSP